MLQARSAVSAHSSKWGSCSIRPLRTLNEMCHAAGGHDVYHLVPGDTRDGPLDFGQCILVGHGVPGVREVPVGNFLSPVQVHAHGIEDAVAGKLAPCKEDPVGVAAGAVDYGGILERLPRGAACGASDLVALHVGGMVETVEEFLEHREQVFGSDAGEAGRAVRCEYGHSEGDRGLGDHVDVAGIEAQPVHGRVCRQAVLQAPDFCPVPVLDFPVPGGLLPAGFDDFVDSVGPQAVLERSDPVLELCAEACADMLDCRHMYRIEQDVSAVDGGKD